MVNGMTFTAQSASLPNLPGRWRYLLLCEIGNNERVHLLTLHVTFFALVHSLAPSFFAGLRTGRTGITACDTACCSVSFSALRSLTRVVNVSILSVSSTFSLT